MPISRSSRQHFVMVGPVAELDAQTIASQISNVTSVHITTVACLRDQAPRTRFTGAELDEMVGILANAWATGQGGRPEGLRLNLAQSRLARRAYAAAVGEPEPDEETLAGIRAGSGA